IQADVRQPEQILNAPELQLLDLDQPVAVLTVALFHFVTDDYEPVELVKRLTTPTVSGSCLVISHFTHDGLPDVTEGKEIYRKGGIESASRSRDDVLALFCDFELVEPGLVWIPQWRPDGSSGVMERPEM